MSENKIRPISLGILRRPSDGALLLDSGYDSKQDKHFYRPIGGGIEFGEKSEEALVREFMEELGKSVETTKLVHIDESIFEYEGVKGHQIMFLHECNFTNSEDYLIDEIHSIEKADHISVWRTIEQIEAENAVVYPLKIMELYSKNAKK